MYRYTAMLFIIISISLKAQSFQWVDIAELNIQFNPTYLRAAVTLDDSANPIYTRLIKFKKIYSSTYYGNVEIKKTTSYATLIWADTLFGGVDVKKIIKDGENNIVCLGSYTDTVRIDTISLTRSSSGTANFLLKLDHQGNVIWLKDGSDFVSEFTEITSLASIGLNNCLLGVGIYPISTNILTINSSGSIINNIEQVNIGTISDMTVDIYNNIWCTGFAFSGSTSFNGLDTIAPFDYNDYIVKYDSTGSAQWLTFIEDVTAQDFYLDSDDSGNIYMSGNLFDSTNFGNLHANGPQWVNDFFVTKINQDGNFIWLNEIPLGNNLGDATVGNGDYLSCTKKGDTYITGFFRGQVNFGNGVQVSSSGISNHNVFVLKYNYAGEVELAKIAGGDLYDHGSSIVADNNGNCYVTGLIQANSVFDTITVLANDNSLFVSKIGLNSVVSVDNENTEKTIGVKSFELLQNYPNPFNPSTSIQYAIGSLPTGQAGMQFVTLKVYDVLGKEIATLVNEEKPSGSYEIKFDGSLLSSGIYFYRIAIHSDKLQAGDPVPSSVQSFVQTKKMILLK